MIEHCGYTYCRALMPPDADACPRCGYPADMSLLFDPARAFSQLPDDLPAAMIDMHQMLPRFPGNLELQQQLADRLGIRWTLLQSAPDQATSMMGNADLRELAVAHPERYVISQFTDPRHPDALEHLQAFAAAGARVVKLLPCTGWSPNDPSLDPFWGAMEEAGLVAMVHTGFITARHKDEERKAGQFLDSENGRPVRFDQVARKFPNLQVILCHMGGAAWCGEACEMVSQHDNVWGDVAGPGIRALLQIMRSGMDLDWRKVFWGNDALAVMTPYNLRLQLGALRSAGLDAVIPEVFHDNAARFGERFLGR
jgi:predicted TIM-barrel fold metal-dependent hydrolase